MDQSIANIRALLADSEKTPLGRALQPLLFANAITALETYLSSTFLNTVLADEQLLRRFFETTPEFLARTVKLSDVFREAAMARTHAEKHLLDVVWHNLAKVLAMCRDTLGIDFRPAMKEVSRAIPIRHDIVLALMGLRRPISAAGVTAPHTTK